MGRLKRVLKDPKRIIYYLKWKGFFDYLSDEKYLKRFYKFKFGKELDLENPKTFNEKLQWLKLYDTRPEYTNMVCKYEAKNFIAEKLDSSYVIPTIGLWDRIEDVDFDALPNQFVLKCTHDSGGVVVCKDKSTLDIKKAKKMLGSRLKRSYYLHERGWPYKNIKPRIIAEEYLSALGDAGLVEYKLFCFGGKVKIVLVCKGTAHAEGRTNDFMDRDFNRIPVKSLNPISEPDPERPEELEQLIEIAEKLSEGIPQLRVDTYIVNGKIYVGEMTFFHNSGMCKFEPEEWDYKFGEWITLPEKKED